MAEYIKREAVIKAIEFLRPSKKLPDDIVKRAANTAHNYIRTAVETIPAADVRENVRGEWLNYHGEKMQLNKRGETTGESYCSVCKMFLMASDEYACYGNFCPNCGADMRQNESVKNEVLNEQVQC